MQEFHFHRFRFVPKKKQMTKRNKEHLYYDNLPHAYYLFASVGLSSEEHNLVLSFSLFSYWRVLYSCANMNAFRARADCIIAVFTYSKITFYQVTSHRVTSGSKMHCEMMMLILIPAVDVSIARCSLYVVGALCDKVTVENRRILISHIW